MLLAVLLAVIVSIGGGIGGWLKVTYERLTTADPKILDQITGQRGPTRIGGVAERPARSGPTARSTGQRKLTISEVFPKTVRKVSSSGVALKLAGVREDGDCATPTWGSEFQATLRAAGCVQVVRGLYQGDGERLGQISLLRTRDPAAAKAAVDQLSAGRVRGFVHPLRTTSAQRPLGEGASFAFTYQHGTLIVVMWVRGSDATEQSRMTVALDEVVEHLS